MLRQLVHGGPEHGPVPVAAQPGLKHPGQPHSHLMVCGFGVAVAVKTHPALLGNLDAIAPRVRRLGTNGLTGGAPAPPNAAATSVEKSWRYIVLVTQRNHLLLGQIEAPAGSQYAAVLARVGIAQHDFLDIADRKSTRLNSSHVAISYAVFCLKKKN